MRILQVISGMGVNGAVLQCMALSQGLVARGHQVILACRTGSWCSAQPPVPGLEIVLNEQRRWPLTDLRRMAALVRSRRIDVVHTHQSRAHLFGVFLRFQSDRPCVATAHSRHVQPHWCFNDFVIANSEATYQFHRRWNLVSERRMRVVQCLLDLERFSAVPADDIARLRQQWAVGDGLLAGIVGDVIPRKGQLYAVRAWSEVVRAFPEARLVFVGEEKDPNYAQRVRQEIECLGLVQHVVWGGYQTNVPAVMHTLDICVSAAVEEALGLTIPEAMAASRAVVATNVGGIPENVRPLETGLLVPPADPHALADALMHMFSDTPWRRECGRRGRQQVLQKYDPQEHLRQTEEIYEYVGLQRARRAG